MAKISMKALMIITVITASALATPIMATGAEYNNEMDFDQFGGADLIGSFFDPDYGFASIFNGFGYGGVLLGRVIQMLLMQGLFNFSESEILPNVYVLSAMTVETDNGTVDYGPGETEIHYVPYEYDHVIQDAGQGFAYSEVTKEGSYYYEIEIGAAITLLIWDNDNSLIRAIKRIISFFHKLRESSVFEEGLDSIPAELIEEGVELITWFLIHINDIFTGEELFALNPITWQNLRIVPDIDFEITKTMKITGPDWRIGTGDDQILASYDLSILEDWNATAKARKDSYMQWLLTPTSGALVETRFTSFTFDLIQLWVKNFEIHIDVGEIMSLVTGGMGGPINIGSIFQGLDIEFYMFSHHLSGAFLYNDSNDDDILSVNYRNLENGTHTVTDPSGDPVQVPETTELTHRLVLGSVGDFSFQYPTVTGANKISWGLEATNVEIVPVPIGVDLDSYLGAAPEALDYIKFGFSFEPKVDTTVLDADGNPVPVLQGAVKLDQFFAPWNVPSAPAANNDIEGLDLAIIYASSMLHFHLNVAVEGEDPDDPTTYLDPSRDYSSVDRTLKVGNYLGDRFAGQLDFVDIAGPDYFYGAEGSTTSAPASTSILPLALFEAEAESHETFEGQEDVYTTFATDIALNISFQVAVYAVCFPEFEDGSGIWHDPTFSVYMIFEPTAFWALILLIGGVGLVGIATVLIKRRKDARY